MEQGGEGGKGWGGGKDWGGGSCNSDGENYLQYKFNSFPWPADSTVVQPNQIFRVIHSGSFSDFTHLVYCFDVVHLVGYSAVIQEVS